MNGGPPGPGMATHLVHDLISDHGGRAVEISGDVSEDVDIVFLKTHRGVWRGLRVLKERVPRRDSPPIEPDRVQHLR